MNQFYIDKFGNRYRKVASNLILLVDSKCKDLIGKFYNVKGLPFSICPFSAKGVSICQILNNLKGSLDEV